MMYLLRMSIYVKDRGRYRSVNVVTMLQARRGSILRRGKGNSLLYNVIPGKFRINTIIYTILVVYLW